MKYSYSCSFSDAVKKLQEFLGLAPCEHTDKVPDGKSSHTLLMSGVFRGGHDILARIRLVLDPVDQTVTMNIVVRSVFPCFDKLSMF